MRSVRRSEGTGPLCCGEGEGAWLEVPSFPALHLLECIPVTGPETPLRFSRIMSSCQPSHPVTGGNRA